VLRRARRLVDLEVERVERDAFGGWVVHLGHRGRDCGAVPVLWVLFSSVKAGR